MGQAVRYSSNDPNKSTTIEFDEETDALTESQNTLQMTDALIQQSVAAAASGQTPHSGSLSSSLALASPNTAASSASVSTNASTTSASLTKSPSIVSPAVKPEIEYCFYIFVFEQKKTKLQMKYIGLKL